MSKYIKLMDGTKSNAGGFEIKLNEVVIADKWDTSTFDPAIMGGFNFSIDEKILRWIHRGDTVYDVEIPADAEVIDCPSPNCPHGVFRSNKIILNNPRKITEEMVMDYYKMSDLPEKTYFQCLVILSQFKNYINVARQIIKDKINKNNIESCIKEFERFISDKHDGNTYDFDYDVLTMEAKDIYDSLMEIKKEILNFNIEPSRLILREYKENDIKNPKYLFHGSPKLLEMIEQRQSHDSNNKLNEDFAVFLTPSFIIASAYAFKDKIKLMSEGLDWDFEIGIDPETNKIRIVMDNVIIDDELEGYIYVFKYNDSNMYKDDLIQYKCYQNIKPLDVVTIRFKDYKKYYEFLNSKQNCQDTIDNLLK